MKLTLMLAGAFLLSPVLGDGHSLCACQTRSNGPTYNPATEACCSRNGGLMTQDELPAVGGIKYRGYYCQGNDISGDKFYKCCNDNGGKDSTCPK